MPRSRYGSATPPVKFFCRECISPKGFSMSKSLNVLVDEELPTAKSALSVPGLDSIGQRVVEISGDVLRASVDGALQSVLSLLSEVSQESETHLVSQVSFSLTFDASGEVSVLSLAKGALKGGTGLQFTITKK